MKTIVIATKNKGKIREMAQAFARLPVKLVPLSDFGDLPEDWECPVCGAGKIDFTEYED